MASDFNKLIKSVSKSDYIGQGNPERTQHPVSKEACEEKAKKLRIEFNNPAFEKICGEKYMAPLYSPATQKPEDAKSCIDQFEYPNLPCEYPVVWVRSSEAVDICEAAGKRLCDAHEWEGACAGSVDEPDYRYNIKGKSIEETIKLRRKAHNSQATRNWAYGSQQKKGICAANSFKHKDCNGGDWRRCGSNTYPSGYFPECKSSLGVYDQHGNAAEHMNLPLEPSQSALLGSTTLGHTEMKGSWFIFDKYYAHQDWCRWRAPYWHGSKVKDPKSHRNYHLGFRCCKSIDPR